MGLWTAQFTSLLSQGFSLPFGQIWQGFNFPHPHTHPAVLSSNTSIISQKNPSALFLPWIQPLPSAFNNISLCGHPLQTRYGLKRNTSHLIHVLLISQIYLCHPRSRIQILQAGIEPCVAPASLQQHLPGAPVQWQNKCKIFHHSHPVYPEYSRGILAAFANQRALWFPDF